MSTLTMLIKSLSKEEDRRWQLSAFLLIHCTFFLSSFFLFTSDLVGLSWRWQSRPRPIPSHSAVAFTLVTLLSHLICQIVNGDSGSVQKWHRQQQNLHDSAQRRQLQPKSKTEYVSLLFFLFSPFFAWTSKPWRNETTMPELVLFVMDGHRCLSFCVVP